MRTPPRAAPRRLGRALASALPRVAASAGTVILAPLLAAVALAPTSASARPAAPAPAPATGPSIVVTGVQPAAGTVEFFLAARDLPTGSSLAQSTITVQVGAVTLPATARAVAGGETTSPTRAVILVIDASGSMAGARIAAARQAAVDYAAAAPPDIQLGLVTVATRPAVVLPPTSDRADFTTAVRRITASGQTALYDGVAATAQLLAGPAAADFVERRIVVLSDGADTSSTRTVGALAAELADVDAVLDAVAFGEADRAELGLLTAATGGRVYPAADGAALRSVFRSMAAGLSRPVVVTATVPPALSGATATLTVQVRAGATKVSTEVPVAFRIDPAAGAGPDTFAPSVTSRTWLLVALAGVGVGLFLITLMILLPVRGRSPVQRRLSQLDRFSLGRRTSVASGPAAVSGAWQAALAVSERAVRGPDQRERIELALDRAGSSLRAAEWQLVRVLVTVGAVVGAGMLLPWWLGVPAGLLGGWLGTGQYLRMRANRRTGKFADQLPDALQLVVGSLRSGFSLAQSLEALVREAADPIAAELGRALAETRLGGNLEDALERVGERNASQDMAWLVMAIRIQREVGGNLSEVLETAVGTMRERARLGRHVRALSAEGRLSALILFGMPVVLGSWMFFFRREYLRPLYTEPLGMAMLGGAAVMMLLGGLWLRKLVRVVV